MKSFVRSYQESFRRSYKLAFWSYEKLHAKLSRKLQAKLELASGEVVSKLSEAMKASCEAIKKASAKL